MKNNNETNTDQIWEQIEKEKKRDVFIRRISRVAWSVTLLVLITFLILTINDLNNTYNNYKAGAVSYESVIGTVMPFIMILGALGLIIGILSTVGTFLRLRTTSLLEIQQRLTNLEQMVVSQNNND